MGGKMSENLKRIFLPDNPAVSAALWGAVTLIGVLGIFASYYLPRNFFVVEGGVSEVTIEANKSVTYEDTARTEANRQAAADRVGDIYAFDSAVLAGQADQMNQLFNAWEELAMLSEAVRLPEPPAAQAEGGDGTGAGQPGGLPQDAAPPEGASPAGAEAGQAATAAGDAGTPEAGGAVPPAAGTDAGAGADTAAAPGTTADGSLPQAPLAGEAGTVLRLADMETKLEKAAPYIVQLQIGESTARAVLEMDTAALQNFRREALSIMSQEWSRGVRDEEVEDARKRMLDEVYLRINNEEQASFLQAVFRFIDLKANFIFDEETTLRAKEEEAAKEPQVLNTVYRNQLVISRGEIVTANHIAILKALGYQRSEAPYVMLIGIALLTGCVFFLLSKYTRQFPRENRGDGKENPLMCLLFLLILGMGRLIVAIDISPESVIAEQIAYLIPASTGAILAAILLGHWLGVFFGMAIGIYVGLLSGGGLSYAVTAFAACLIGVYGISRYTNRSEWAKAGLMIALVNIWMAAGFGILNSQARTTILIAMVIGAVNGFFSPILAYGSLPFLESVFKITTSVSLMELSDPRQPLLKELLLKAPGTYHHSILVGNLAEAAADRVGADPVLVRVGAYYHDIGKTKRPYFFIENQLTDANPHEKLTPALSALILNAHVKDGLEIGRKYKLPEKVIDFIAQHHGDSMMAYFYRKAMEEAEDKEQVRESDFRYPGPCPQTKETALVMMADSVEAAIRSMHVTGDKIEAAVKKVINDKMNDGQLEESPLSLSDLKAVIQVFTKVLNGIYHNRIEYPDNVLAVMNKAETTSAVSAVSGGPAGGSANSPASGLASGPANGPTGALAAPAGQAETAGTSPAPAVLAADRSGAESAGAK